MVTRQMFTRIMALGNLTDYRLQRIASSIEVDGVPLRTAAEVRLFLKEMQPNDVEYDHVEGCIRYNSKREEGVRDGRSQVD